MQLTEQTLNVLRNFASINSNIIINEGNLLKTISEAKNLLATTTLDVEFPQTFGIYDLNEFLSVLSLVDSPNLTFNDDYVLVGDSSGRSRIKYYFSDIDILTKPKKDIVMPECEVSFILDRSTMSKVKKAASVLGHTELSVSVIDNVLSLSVIDNNDKTANVFSTDVDGKFTDTNFNFVFGISNLKMIDGDYEVFVSSKLISKFVSINQNANLQYWCALEKSSFYGENV